LNVYDTTQDPVALKASAEVAIKLAFQNYSVATLQEAPLVAPPPTKKLKRFAQDLLPQDELIIYLTEPRIPGNSNPLDYWRTNKGRLPILARMARDYLPLQPTSKDVEGTFSKGRRTIPYYRRSQNASSIRNQMLVNSGYNLGVFK
jgi:hAT family C-terminal dimerisation region